MDNINTDTDHVMNDDLIPICHVVTPVGNMGYGFHEDETAGVVESCVSSNVPTAIILDSGSTDSGPSKLGLGDMSCPRSAYVRDLTKLLRLVDRFKVPLIFSSAGGDGSDDHVREMVRIIEEIASVPGNEHYQLKTIAIFAEIQKSLVRERLSAGVISGCGPVVPTLTEDNIERSSKVVSQMGPEPFLDAMLANPDFNVIVGGRAYDPSPYIAYAAFKAGVSFENTSTEDKRRLFGGFAHMGKIMECGAQCATPKSHGATATLYSNGTFDISPHSPHARCTPQSVAAHTLYEKSRPDLLYGPGGHLDLTAAEYEQLEDGRTCRMHGATFTFSRDAGLPYRTKLEGAQKIGYRAMFMGSIRDPCLIGQLDTFLEDLVKPYIASQHKDAGEWQLEFHKYGQHQVSTLPNQLGQAGEVMIIGEALASTQEIANSLAATARFATAHGGYANQKATSGNLAWGIGGKLEIELGPCAEFCIYHLMDLQHGEEGLSLTPKSKGLYSQSVAIIGKGELKAFGNGTATPNGTASFTSKVNNSKPKTALTGKVKQDTGVLPSTLGDIALFLRSKNAGPYEVTFDIMFEKEEVYRLVKDSDILNKHTVAEILERKEEEIVWIGFFDQARAFKVTIPRLRNGRIHPNGSYMENDIWAAQQYLPLMNMRLPESFIRCWKADKAGKL